MNLYEQELPYAVIKISNFKNNKQEIQIELATTNCMDFLFIP